MHKNSQIWKLLTLKQWPTAGDICHYPRRVAVLAISVLLLAACGNAVSGGASPRLATTPTSTASAITSPSTLSSPVVAPLAVVHVKILTQGTMYVFVPTTLTVKVGTQVIWSNDSNAPHTVSSDAGVFDTPDPLGIKPGQMYAFTFIKPGIYSYYCNIHTYMTGKIVVNR